MTVASVFIDFAEKPACLIPGNLTFPPGPSDMSRMLPRPQTPFPLLALLVLACSPPPDELAPPRPVETMDILRYETDLDLGEIRSHRPHEFQLPLENVSGREVALENIAISCACTRLRELPERLGPGERVTVSFATDPTLRPYPNQTTRLTPLVRVDGERLSLPPITVTLIHAPLYRFEPSTLAMPPSFERTEGEIRAGGSAVLSSRTGDPLPPVTFQPNHPGILVTSQPTSPAALRLEVALSAQDLMVPPRDAEIRVHGEDPLIEGLVLGLDLGGASPVALDPDRLLISGLVAGAPFEGSVTIQPRLEGLSLVGAEASGEDLQATVGAEGLSLTIEGLVPPFGRQPWVERTIRLRFEGPAPLERPFTVRFHR